MEVAMNEPIIPQIIPFPNKQIIDISHQKFGRLLVIGYVGTKHERPQWLCLCDCGKYTVASGKYIRKGKTISCGCFRQEVTGAKKRTHGQTQTDEYIVWAGMCARCRNENHIAYQNYGGRGIKVCNRWQNFENFLSDMGKRPTSRHSIDRIDNGGDYCPENCRWATVKEQNNNARSNRILDFDGKSMNIAQWADFLDISRSAITNRLRYGWTVERTLSEPVRKLSNRK
jgi:hypothetical protein